MTFLEEEVPVFGEQVWVVDKFFRIRAFSAYHHHAVVPHLGKAMLKTYRRRKTLFSSLIMVSQLENVENMSRRKASLSSLTMVVRSSTFQRPGTAKLSRRSAPHNSLKHRGSFKDSSYKCLNMKTCDESYLAWRFHCRKPWRGSWWCRQLAVRVKNVPAKISLMEVSWRERKCKRSRGEEG